MSDYKMRNESLQEQIKYDLVQHPLDRNPGVLAQAYCEIQSLEAELERLQRHSVRDAVDLGAHGAIYLSYSEYDEQKCSPMLVIQGDDGMTGYFVDPCTAELTRTCVCHAHSETDCLCGAWREEKENRHG